MRNYEEANCWDKTITAPDLILNLPNLVIEKLTGRHRLLPRWLSALILGAGIFLPSYVLAFLLGERQQLRDIGWTVFSSLELTYLAVVLCYTDFNLNVLSRLKRKIIPCIVSRQDRASLMSCVQLAIRPKAVPVFVLSTAIGVTAVIGGTLAYGRNPGFALPLSATIGGMFAGIGVYYMTWTLHLTRRLGSFKFAMNEFTPGSSKIIHEILGMLNAHLYTIALFMAAVTIVNSFDRFTVWFVWVDVVIGWLPITAQFFLTQQAVGEIIANAKWDALEQIQSEIRNLKNNGQLKDKETTEAINRLLDLHDRIQKTRSTTLNFRAGLNFLNQLMLPVVGWLIGNIEKLALLIRSLLNITR